MNEQTQLDDMLDEHAPIQYLLLQEENQIRLRMDLRKPFDNAIFIGSERQKEVVDISESYCLMKGLYIYRRLCFEKSGHHYLVLLTRLNGETEANRVVIFRDCPEGFDDLWDILDILKDERLQGVRRLDINAEVDVANCLFASGLHELYIITAEDFDNGF